MAIADDPIDVCMVDETETFNTLSCCGERDRLLPTIKSCRQTSSTRSPAAPRFSGGLIKGAS